MVYYIRFLKTPKLDVGKGTARALITITTDLGDCFYPADLPLHITLVPKVSEYRFPITKIFQWKQGMRTLRLETKFIPNCQSSVKLLVSSWSEEGADDGLFGNVPEILSAWSESFGPNCPEAGNKIGRHFITKVGSITTVYEETGESIARHIWDAGIALATFLSRTTQQPGPPSRLANILLNPGLSGPRVLELGSGCGIVGLQIAQISPSSDVVLTDLREAMDILDYNVSRSRNPSSGLKLSAEILDWSEPLPESVVQRRFDLLIISDCTYNPDSIPALVETLAALIELSPTALIVISMKKRHESEAIFFGYMARSGLVQADHFYISLPDRQKSDTGQALETVDIYTYFKSHAPTVD